MCRYFTLLERNNLNQSVFICEHDTLHLMHNNVAIMMSRRSFYYLADMLNTRCVNCCQPAEMAVRWTQNPDSTVNLWIGKGAMQLTLFEFGALSALVQRVAKRLKSTPLENLLRPTTPSMKSSPDGVDFSLN